MNKTLLVVIGSMLLIAGPASSDVVNGTFTAGNTGFSSDYTFVGSSGAIGNYSIATSPGAFESGLESFGDHTSGTGNMMLVDGSAGTAVVWGETIAVTPATSYTFAGFFRPTFGGNLPQIAMSVANGNAPLATLPASTLVDGQWQQLALTFNSGAASSVTVSFTDQNPNFAQAGDDFAADDLALAPVPVPEPASLAIMSVSTLLILNRKRRA